MQNLTPIPKNGRDIHIFYKLAYFSAETQKVRYLGQFWELGSNFHGRPILYILYKLFSNYG